MHLLAAADGRFPPVDGGCTVLPPLPGGLACSVAFTGHAFVATAHPPEAVLARGADGYGGATAPDLLRWLAGPDGWIDVIDVTLVARGTGGPGLPPRHDAEGHPRVQHAKRLRRDVRVYGDERGLVTLSRGLAGRTEISIEVEAVAQGRGWGRSLLRDALGLAPAGEPVFAGVAPGNARSLRAFLAVGFVPLGSECVIRPGRVGGPER